MARGMPLAVISAGTLVIAAAGDFGRVYAVIILGCATALVAVTVIVEGLALSWKPGADIDELEGCSKEAKSDADALARRMAATSTDHYRQNKNRLSRIRKWCGVQALAVLASASALTAGMYNLPSDAARQQDRINQQAQVLNGLVASVSQELTRLELEIQSLSYELDGLSGER